MTDLPSPSASTAHTQQGPGAGTCSWLRALSLTSVHVVPQDPGGHRHLRGQESQVQALCPHLLPGDFSWAPSSFLPRMALPA